MSRSKKKRMHAKENNTFLWPQQAGGTFADCRSQLMLQGSSISTVDGVTLQFDDLEDMDRFLVGVMETCDFFL